MDRQLRIIRNIYERDRGKGRPKLFCAIEKYQWHNFVDEVIHECYSTIGLDLFEDVLIEKFDSIKNGYNCKGGGANGRHGEESCNKMSIIRKEFYKNNQEALKKMHASHRAAKAHKNHTEANRNKMTPCMCITTDQYFESTIEAQRAMGVPNGNISAVLHEERKSAGGYTFRYATSEEIEKHNNSK